VHADDFRVSIIITSHNQRDYLVQALESVMAQTLRSHEIIVADDASSDGSQEVIRRYAQRHPGWIKYLFQERNVRTPKNRNAALLRVSGNYVGILDGDDLFAPDKLQLQYQALRALPGARAVYSNFRGVDAAGRLLRRRYREPQPQGDIFPTVAIGNFGLLRTLVAEYRAVREAGFMDERFPGYDGLWLTIKLSSFCRLAYVHKPLVYKRDYPTSVSKRRAMADKMGQLSGVYRALQPLLGRVDRPTAQAIRKVWQRRFAYLADIARQERATATPHRPQQA
jgi:glycosyltransferase involved in cell wall biosynthesis